MKRRITPGIPRIPTNIADIRFKGICMSQNEPIKLITSISNPPKTLFTTSFNNILIGTRNT